MLETIKYSDIKQTKNTTLTKLAFRNRFTFLELIAIEEAAVTDAGVRVLQTNLNVADFIDTSDVNTQQGLLYLVSKNLLTQQRASEILC